MFGKKKCAKEVTPAVATKGDLVKLGDIEYKVSENGSELIVTEIGKAQGGHARGDLMKKKAELEITLGVVNDLLKKMDELGVS